MIIRFCLAIVLACSALWSEAAIVPGDPAPDLVVRDAAGAAVKLSAYRQKKHVALLAMPADRVTAGDWADTIRRLAKLDTLVLFGDGPAATEFIDRNGVVRRVLSGRVLTGAALEHFVELWQDGKTYFVAYCARCHGEEGADTLCVEKPLTGVGRRLSPEQMRESLRMGEVNDREVIIRGEMVKRSQLDAILVYVSGL